VHQTLCNFWRLRNSTSQQFALTNFELLYCADVEDVGFVLLTLWSTGSEMAGA